MRSEALGLAIALGWQTGAVGRSGDGSLGRNTWQGAPDPPATPVWPHLRVRQPLTNTPLSERPKPCERVILETWWCQPKPQLFLHQETESSALAVLPHHSSPDHNTASGRHTPCPYAASSPDRPRRHSPRRGRASPLVVAWRCRLSLTSLLSVLPMSDTMLGLTRVLHSHESMAHPPPGGAVSANVRESSLKVSVWGTERYLRHH